MAEGIKGKLTNALDYLQRLKEIGGNQEGAAKQPKETQGNQVNFQKTNENELQECNFEADMKAGSFNFENNFNQPKTEESNMQIQDSANAQNNADLKEQPQTQATPSDSAPKAEENNQIKGPENAQENKNEGQNNFFSSGGNNGTSFNEELETAFKELEKLKNG